MNNIRNALKLGQTMERLTQEMEDLRIFLEREELEKAQLQAALMQAKCEHMEVLIGAIRKEAEKPCPTCGCASAAPGSHHHDECPHYSPKSD